jgi:hypothetical protein
MDVGEIATIEGKKAFECGWMVVAAVKERERGRRSEEGGGAVED